MSTKPLPIGIEDFKKLREKNYYYIDKSTFIKELMDNGSEASLFMGPGRFGKTLGLSKNLMETISFYDYREDYYHGFLAVFLK